MESTQKKVVVDFIKAFSCAYSVTKNLSDELGVANDRTDGAVCPVDCCVDDEDRRETEEELLSKKAFLHAE